MPLFAVYVDSKKQIAGKRVAINRRIPITYADKKIILNRLFGANPPIVLWLMADEELEIEDKIREQFNGLQDFINNYSQVV
jgi:hypothetical protein